MKYTEEEFKKEIEKIYGTELTLVGRFKGISKPILVQDKYGVLSISLAKLVLQNKPSIFKALNKTEYFMNMLKDKYPEIHKLITPLSEYSTMKESMLFQDKYGVVSTTPDALMAGHFPTIRAAVDRKKYFKEMLFEIYGDKYDFIIETTDRKNGRSILVCPEHGEVDIDNEYIFQGKGCPKCASITQSNAFYLIELSTETESFYKLGISYINRGEIRRYSDYRKQGYKIKELKTLEFENPRDCRDLELKLKRLIKNDLYTPINWEYNSSTECFKKELLDIILENLVIYDIV